MASFNDAAKTPVNTGADPVSRPELERLEAQRRAAAPLRALTPPGMQKVSSELDQQREDRIRHIENRLEAQRGHAATDFSLGQMRGKAKADFDRER